MAEFKVGGKVICIESRILESTLGLKVCYNKDQVYEVQGIHVCKCGDITLWLGDLNNLGKEQFSQCGTCDDLIRTQKVLVLAKFFIPLDDFKEVTFTKINEEVPVSAQ